MSPWWIRRSPLAERPAPPAVVRRYRAPPCRNASVSSIRPSSRCGTGFDGAGLRLTRSGRDATSKWAPRARTVVGRTRGAMGRAHAVRGQLCTPVRAAGRWRARTPARTVEQIPDDCPQLARRDLAGATRRRAHTGSAGPLTLPTWPRPGFRGTGPTGCCEVGRRRAESCTPRCCRCHPRRPRRSTSSRRTAGAG